MTSHKYSNIIAGLYGNALEWYDFLLYASFAPLFAELFFPAEDRYSSLFATFGIFAIGFFVRPLGGALLGHYGDRIGRRKALIISISIMTLGTLGIALLPTYAMCGILAPILLTLFRIIQGLAVGGELPGASTYLIEHMPSNRRGLAGSLIMSTAFLGIFLGSFTAAGTSIIFSIQQMTSWGWRLAYVIGALLGLFGLYLRLHSKETPHFTPKEHTQKNKLPIHLLISNHKTPLILGVVVTSALALGNYILIAFVTSFLVKFNGYTLSSALLINFIALFALTILLPCVGLLSDYIGRKPVFMFGVFILLILAFPIFKLLMNGSFGYALLEELLLAIALAPINSTVPTILAEIFPTEIRNSGTSIAYNIGQAVFGGTAPLIAFYLMDVTKNMLAPAWYLAACTLAVLLIVIFYKETYKKDLSI